VTAYGARGLLIGVYRLIGTFRAYGGLSKWSCVPFVPIELMGGLVRLLFYYF